MESCGEQVVRIGGGDDRRAEFALDGHDMVMARQVGGQDGTRGGVDPVGIEVDELEIAFGCHIPDGLDITHGWVIGRLRAHIERESSKRL